MKRIHTVCLVLALTALAAGAATAQSPRTGQNRGRRADARLATRTYQLLGFTITTGGDDLRTDSSVLAHLTFQDDPSYDCVLHGNVAGGSANLTWDNNSTHIGPPCLLRKAMTLPELRQVRIALVLSSSGIGASPDNWNVNRVVVTAYNPGTTGKACLFSVSGEPLARLTDSQPQATISDFPNQCR